MYEYAKTAKSVTVGRKRRGVLPEKGELHLANSEVCATIPHIFSYLHFLTNFEKRYGAVTFFLPLALDLT